jgi:hypothetical protein
MAITTLDGAIAGMQPPRYFAKVASGVLVAGRPHTWWALGGVTGAGSYNTTLNGAVLTGPVAGQIPRTDPGSGNSYLARFSGVATQVGTLLLCDRIWQNRLANSTGAQSITSPTWPARDVAGSTAGDGILLGLELSTASSAGTPTCEVTYTNQAGTGSKTANLIDAFSSTTAVGSFLRYDLAAGDTGIRSIQSANLSATLTGGVCNLVAYRVLASLEIVAAFNPNAVDVLTSGMPKIYDGSVPFLVFIPNSTSATVTSGTYIETQG